MPTVKGGVETANDEYRKECAKQRNKAGIEIDAFHGVRHPQIYGKEPQRNQRFQR